MKLRSLEDDAKAFAELANKQAARIRELEAELETCWTALRSITYLAHNGSQDRPLWKRLSMIAEYADRAMIRAAQEKANE